jgi:uncharacterized membrane protein required for colicin V production
MIDIFLIISIILIAWFGWNVGFTRTFFAVLAGFLAIFVASKYPYQEGINFYLIFVITALFVVVIGAFTLRLIKFFYLNILDRIGGAILSICIWLIVSINIIIPTIIQKYALDESEHTIHYAISNIMQSKFQGFKSLMPQMLKKDYINTIVKN